MRQKVLNDQHFVFFKSSYKSEIRIIFSKACLVQAILSFYYERVSEFEMDISDRILRINKSLLSENYLVIFLSWFVLFCVIINFYLTRIHRIFSWFLAFLKFCSLYFYICEPFGVRLFFLHVKGLRFISFLCR